jgi:MATE family multidrug resistance protein
MMYTEEPEVLSLNSTILPLTALVCILDAVQTICGGILRGAGRPHIGTISNFIGYYLVSMPLFFL